MMKAKELLEKVTGKSLSREERTQMAGHLSALLLTETLEGRTNTEKQHLQKLARMMDDPLGKVFTTTFTDQCFRSQSPKRTANQMVYLLKRFGIPRYLPFVEYLGLFAFRFFGRLFPKLLVPIAQKQIRKELRSVILPEDPEALQAYFQLCQKKHIRLNINHLGEAILGEAEAERRLNLYLEDLKNPLIDYISIKISTIFSQINQIAWNETMAILSERLQTLYRAALAHPTVDVTGEKQPKFVNLDMEEYKDLDFTVALFMQVLNQEEFIHLSAGIVLQSYIPNSFLKQKEITEWAVKRVKNGGAPIKIRLVKGANLEMEEVESSIKGWNLPSYHKKSDADANFKRMIEYALIKEHAEAVMVGIGSHNLFDISYALLLRAENKVEEHVTFEMLAGMAEPMQRAVHAASGGMLLYCPEAKAKDFHNAISYLIRRLDENTGENNFLRHLFDLEPQSHFFQEQKSFFEKSVTLIDTVKEEAKRHINRLHPPDPLSQEAPFVNEPDTDFSVPENRIWADQIFKKWKKAKIETIPLVIDGKEIVKNIQNGFDPSRPNYVPYTYSHAEKSDIDNAFTCAKSSEKKWAERPLEERGSLIAGAAQKFRERWGALIGAMIMDGGKTIPEADIEVAEAVDFCEYYIRNAKEITKHKELQWRPKGTILIASPWNFPLSIPVGGIAAALTAGNVILFKPAPETVFIGWMAAKAFWDAGVPKEVLQFINCPDNPVGSYAISHPDLSGVILTGATETAHLLRRLNPSLDLMAETGGKNALIATSLCDRDLAIKDAVHSAFGHGGQKCSACSLLILEKELYDDPSFLRQLKEAAESFPVGSAWNRNTHIAPLIHPPNETLKKGLSHLDEGESWLLETTIDSENPNLISPAIKLGVKALSFSHQTEFFGPLLSVMRAENLDHAIELANGTAYGLTSGIHSLDEREQEIWREKIIAGNLYINRGITGAIVRRQPFGGCKASGVGPGAKAGGPNYVAELSHATQIALPSEKGPVNPEIEKLFTLFPLTDEQKHLLETSARSYCHWSPRLQTPQDPSRLLGQDNLFYHVPREKMVLRLTKRDPLIGALQSVAAALACQTPLEINSSDEAYRSLGDLSGCSFYFQEENAFINIVSQKKIDRIRLLSPPSESLKKAAAEGEAILLQATVLATGRFELLHYFREVSLSHDYHRYGHLGMRGHKK